jgi:hypothetical protein
MVGGVVGQPAVASLNPAIRYRLLQLEECIWECSNKVLLRRSGLRPGGRHAGRSASAAINSRHTCDNKRASSGPHTRRPLSSAIRSLRTSIAT